MEADEPAAFDIQLEWSGDEYQRPNDRPAASRDEPAPPATAPAPNTSSPPAVTATPLLPALAVRVDDVLSAVASLSARVDALASTSQTAQSAMSNRLIEHLESTIAATSTQNEALDEYRRATERSIAELRRATVASDKLLRTLVARLDEVSTEVRLATEAAGAPASDLDLEAVQAAIAGEIAEELVSIREELTRLKRRIGVRGRSSGALDDTHVKLILERIDAGAGESSPAPALSNDDFDRIVDAIVERLATVLEIVPDEEPAAQTPSATPPPASGSARRGRAPRA